MGAQGGCWLCPTPLFCDLETVTDDRRQQWYINGKETKEVRPGSGTCFEACGKKASAG